MAFGRYLRNDRSMVRKMLAEGEFIEVFIDTPIDVCESRDPKGLYKKARAGEIKDFTGITSAYEAPENSEIHVKTDEMSVAECAKLIVDFIKGRE